MKRKTEFHIYVSRSCIDNSERNSLHWCIFALAIISSIPGSIHVRVDKDETRFSFRGLRYIFPTPDKSATIAQDYDEGRLMKGDILPWRDVLKDPISIEKIQHRRPAKKKIAQRQGTSDRCTTRRSTRWSGRRI